MLYDTHAHINFAAYKENYKTLIEQTLAQGLWLNNVGTQKDTSAEAVRIANEFAKGVYAVVGLHPIHTLKQEVDEEESHFKSREEKFDYDFYRKLAENPKVVGIGECGLDYYRTPQGQSLEEVKAIQLPAFRQQILLAKELNKALAIHCRASKDSFDAYEDILEILRQEKPQRFEIHSFTANWQVAQKFLELGGYIGLNGIITFDKTGVLAEVIRNCPLQKIVLETDAPYLAPVPFRGKKNEPAYLQYVVGHIAALKNQAKEEVAEITTANALALFGLQNIQ
jgi:TatD DNase family protein